MLALLIGLALLVTVGQAEAQTSGGQCLLLGFRNLPSNIVTLSCYGLDSTYNVKVVRVCPDFLGYACSALAYTASFTKNGSDLTATFPEGTLPHGYSIAIQYCAQGQSGPNCTPAGGTAFGTAVGNCRQLSFDTTTDELGRVWSCIHN